MPSTGEALAKLADPSASLRFCYEAGGGTACQTY